MIVDKNGNELKIGDVVHYYRKESTHEFNGRTYTRPARDITFRIDGLVDSPFVKYGGYDSRLEENRLWLTGPELENTRTGSRNSVSPLAVVKIVSLTKHTVGKHKFLKPKQLDVSEAFTSDKPSKLKSFLEYIKPSYM
jgi:hypothetical protein